MCRRTGKEPAVPRCAVSCSEGSIYGYVLVKNGKIVATGKRIGGTTYLDAVEHVDSLFVE